MHNLRITDSKVEVHKGQDLIKEYHDGDTLSKNTLIRRFCGNCVGRFCRTRFTCPRGDGSNNVDMLIIHDRDRHCG